MPQVKVDPGVSGTAQAVQKLHEELYRVVPYDYIDWLYSNYLNLRPPNGPTWANIPSLFGGDHQHQASLVPIAPNNNFKFVFVKPIWLNWTYVKCAIQNKINTMRVTYADGTVEFLVHGTLFDGGYDTFAPPTQAIPVHSVEFWNMGATPANLYELLLTMADVGGGGGGGIIASPNHFYTDEGITPIPAGLIGVAVLFGFNSQAIIIKNSSSQIIEVSEDAGVTWGKIDPQWAIAFDAKLRTGLSIRDPAGIGGLAYRTWAW